MNFYKINLFPWFFIIIIFLIPLLLLLLLLLLLFYLFISFCIYIYTFTISGAGWGWWISRFLPLKCVAERRSQHLFHYTIRPFWSQCVWENTECYTINIERINIKKVNFRIHIPKLKFFRLIFILDFVDYSYLICHNIYLHLRIFFRIHLLYIRFCLLLLFVNIIILIFIYAFRISRTLYHTFPHLHSWCPTPGCWSASPTEATESSSRRTRSAPAATFSPRPRPTVRH